MFAYRQSAAGREEIDNVTLNSVQAGSLIVVFFYSFYPGRPTWEYADQNIPQGGTRRIITGFEW